MPTDFSAVSERAVRYVTRLREAGEEGATAFAHVAEFFLGSVSDEVVRKSHVPVLVIKP